MKSSPSSAYNRRHFLRALGGASAATVTPVAAPASVAEAYDPGRGETRTRYRETEDVKAFYYRTNRYEGEKDVGAVEVSAAHADQTQRARDSAYPAARLRGIGHHKHT